MNPGDRIVGGRFPLGQLVVSSKAIARLTPEEIADGVIRHARGDWGDVSRADAAENDLSLREGFRLLSAYGQGERRFWVISEADRSLTTVLLPEDY